MAAPSHAVLDPGDFLALPVEAPTDVEALVAVAGRLTTPGYVLEFGVWEGRSIRFLAKAVTRSRLRPRQAIHSTVHGFDSFEGLPAPWKWDAETTIPAGRFAMTGYPDVPRCVRLHKGWFHETLPRWLARHPGPVALAHLDCDLYQSAATVLTCLSDRLVPGSVLVFDELCDWTGMGYTAWPDGEWRALTEWLATSGRTVRPIMRGPRFSGAVEVVA